MNFSIIDKYLDGLTECGVPACELSVTYKGEQIYRKCVGFSDSAKTKPTCSEDIYWIFSATKVITCTAAMMLVDRGVIKLDDPVSKYIPEYANLLIKNKDGKLSYAENTMTIEHLFTMTGGMTYNLGTSNVLLAKKEDRSTLGIVKALAKDPLSFEPGTRYQYSLCHDVLAAVVEVASEMRFSDFLQKNIFDPLGMKDIGFRPSEEQKKRFSAMYVSTTGTAEATEIDCTNNYCVTEDYDSGGAGLFSTVDDYIKLITVLACGGTTKDGYKILSPEAIAMMGENRLCDDALNDFGKTRLFGYGWGLCGRAHRNPHMSLAKSPVGEFGWDGACGAFALVDAKNQIAFYFGTHIRGYQYLYHSVHPTLRDMIYEAIQNN